MAERNTTALSSIFDYRTNQWNALQDMKDPRWYNPSVAMPDGTVFTVSGSGGTRHRRALELRHRLAAAHRRRLEVGDSSQPGSSLSGTRFS